MDNIEHEKEGQDNNGEHESLEEDDDSETKRNEYYDS